MAKNTGTRAGIALAGLAAAAAAGYYFYASEDAKKHRKIAATWARDLKDDVVKQAKKVKNLDKRQMLKIIDNATDAYHSAKTVDRKALMRAAKELKANWKLLVAEMGGAGKAVKRSVKKASKKARRSA